MSETLSDDEFREFHRIVQEAALAAYPNPERLGCPGKGILREIANTPLPFKHISYEHVAKCSPCLREMLDFRSEFVSSRKRRRNMVTGAIVAAALIGLIAGGLSLYLTRSSSPGERVNYGRRNRPDISGSAILLTPNFLRGKTVGRVNTLTLSSVASPLQLSLELESDAYPLYNVVVQTEAGKVITSRTGLKSLPSGSERRVVISVSSDVFDRGTYTLILRGKTTEGATHIVNLYELVVK
jgi:hypothetical protein